MKNSRDYNYFEAFINLSEFSLKSAELLHKTLKGFQPSKIEEKRKEIHNIEHGADVAKHDMLNRLVKEFLPPIEREDITSLSHRIDNVTDAVEDVLIYIDIFNVKTIRPEIHKFTELIVECCKAVHKALVEFQHFRKSKKLHEIVIEINRLEEEGDELYINGVKNLYKTSNDPMEVMIWTDIYRSLEKCCDACEDVVNDIENIVIKNS